MPQQHSHLAAGQQQKQQLCCSCQWNKCRRGQRLPQRTGTRMVRAPAQLQVSAVQSSMPGVAPQASTGTTAHPPSPLASTSSRDMSALLPIRVVGVGARANGILAKLNGGSNEMPLNADYWALDWDAKQLEAATSTGAQGALLQAPARTLDAVCLDDVIDSDKLTNLCGPVTFSDGSPGCAVVFVVACGGDSPPGGPSMVAQLVARLRSGGHFVVVAMAQPFAFEGPRKQDASRKLLAELHNTAHTIVSVDQNVLINHTRGLAVTAQQAKEIADGALEHAVRGVVGALWGQELLVLCNGAAAWHGKARGHYLRQRMSSPLQQLLTQPGSLALGRGLAGMPRATAVAIDSPGTALQCLAADAVAAAAESPFLEEGLKDAVGLLCCIVLPSVQDLGGKHGADDLPTTRLAVQAAASSLMEILKDHPAAQTMLICAQPALRVQGQLPDPVTVEATLMIMRTPTTAPTAAMSSAAAPPSSSAAVQPSNSFNARRGYNPQAPSRKLPASVWSAMSALAGGSAQALRPSVRPSVGEEARVGTQSPNNAPPARGGTGQDRAGQGGAVGGGPGQKAQDYPVHAGGVGDRLRLGSVDSRGAVKQGSEAGKPLAEQQPAPTRGATGAASGGTPSPVAAGGGPVGGVRMQSLDVPRDPRDKYPRIMDLPKEAIMWRMQTRSILEVVEEVTDEGGMLSALLPARSQNKPTPPTQASARAWLVMDEAWVEDSDDEAEEPGTKLK